MTPAAFPPPEWLLGVPVHPSPLAAVVRRAGEWIDAGRRGVLCFANVHVVMEARRSPAVRRALLRADGVVPDGMPLAWFLRARGHPDQDRVYGPDFMLAVLARAAGRGDRVFLFGGTAATLARLRTVLRRRFPRLRIVGAVSPPFRERATAAEDRLAVRWINAARPDIVFVGLGAPKQELWMARNRGRLRAPVLAGVGAAFDFHAGTVAQAPARLRGLGLEWLYRLAAEPRRLWRRYLLLNPAFMVLLAGQACGLVAARRAPAGGR